jgi:hypothetical protein
VGVAAGYVRRRYLSPQAAQSIEIANATFAARDHALWRAGTTAVVSGSPHSARVQRPVAVPVLGMDGWPSRGHGSRTSEPTVQVIEDRDQENQGLYVDDLRKSRYN